MILAVLMGLAAAMLVLSPWIGGGLYPDALANVATGLAIGLFWGVYFFAKGGVVPGTVVLTSVLLLALGQVAARRAFVAMDELGLSEEPA